MFKATGPDILKSTLSRQLTKLIFQDLLASTHAKKVVDLHSTVLPTLSVLPMQVSDFGKTFFQELYGVKNTDVLDNKVLCLGIQGHIIKSAEPYVFLGVLLNLHHDTFSFFDISAVTAPHLSGQNMFDILTVARRQLQVTGQFILPHKLVQPISILTFTHPFSPEYTLLSLSTPGIFDQRQESCLDFQKSLASVCPDYRDKTVLEIGLGIGISLPTYIANGIRSLHATEISPVHFALSRWNLEYLLSGGQINPSWREKIHITLEPGFYPQVEAALYVFNAPRAVPKRLYAEFQQALSLTSESTQGLALQIHLGSHFIIDRHFAKLFENLQQKLNTPQTAALWRIIIDPRSDYFLDFTRHGAIDLEAFALHIESGKSNDDIFYFHA